MTKTVALFALGMVIAFALVGVVSARGQHKQSAEAKKRVYAVRKTDAEWRKILTAEQFDVLRQAGTERAYSGKLWNNKEKGTYACAGCGQMLFSSDTKFESGTGWPSFWKPISPTAVAENKDTQFGMTRIETVCARCGGHLGHVFDDGPKPTGLRYCMNSAALRFLMDKHGAMKNPAK